MAKIRNLLNLRFGKLQVVELLPKRKFGNAIWLCKCDCGNTTEVIGSRLVSGKTHMCNQCLKIQRKKVGSNIGNRKRLHDVFRRMRNRCYNPNCDVYKHYGERGIKICDDWLNDFDSFYDWAVRNGYEYGLSIERIDVNGNYCPKNCIWIPLKEQAHNRRDTVYVCFRNQKISLAKICNDLDIDYYKIASYINRTYGSKDNIQNHNSNEQQ